MPSTASQTVAETSVPSESTGGIGALGLDVQRFEGQIVTFAILLLIMWRWVYRPLLKKMDERAKKIEDGLQFSEAAQKAKADATAEFERVVSQAKAEAHALLSDTQEKAEVLRQDRMKQAKVEIEKIALEAKAQIKAERQAAYDALQGDIANLVTASLTKIAGNLDEKTRKALVNDAIKEVEK